MFYLDKQPSRLKGCIRQAIGTERTPSSLKPYGDTEVVKGSGAAKIYKAEIQLGRWRKREGSEVDSGATLTV